MSMQSARRTAHHENKNHPDTASYPDAVVASTLCAPRSALSWFRSISILLLLITSSLLPNLAAARTDWPIVIPAFRNDSGDATWDWLSVGFPEAARTKLHGTIYMRAMTWEEINHILTQDSSLSGNLVEISKQLRSDLLLLGSYNVNGDTVQLVAQCIDPASGRVLATFRSLGSTFEPWQALDDLFTQIAQALHIDMPATQRETIRRQGTSIVDAFQAHSQGLLALSREEDRASAISDAKAHFREAISLDPKYGDPQYRLATLLQHEKDIAGAERAYRDALIADIDHRDARYRLGLLLIDQDRKSEAMSELDHALKQAPEDPQMQAALSSIWFDQYQSNFAQAADGIRQAIAATPDDVNLYVELGNVHHEMSQIRQAAAQYRIALDKDASHPEAAYKLGMIEHNTGNTTTAIKLLEQAIANGTKETRANFYLGQMFTRKQDYAGAVRAFTSAIEAEPNNTPGYLELGNAHSAAGSPQDALIAYSKYAQINKDEAIPHLKIGKTYQAMGLAKQAKSAFEKSLQVDPKFADGHIAIAELYIAEKLTFRAAKSYKEALRIQPDHPRAEELKALIRKYQPAPAGNRK
jgi:tetratricopeptide (TPR) repeat protein